MAFPDGWPPRSATSTRSIRFFIPATGASADFADNAFLFSDQAAANTYRATTFVAPGDEKKPTPLGAPSADFGVGVSGPSASPMGGGRDPRDAVPFHPNLFQRGVLFESTFVLSGSTITYTDPNRLIPFDRDLIGKNIRITDATSGGNDGTFVITNALSAKEITWENSGGASEAGSADGVYRIRRINDAVPKEMLWASNIRIINAGGGDLELSFNGIDVQGLVPSGEIFHYYGRYEAGIAVRGVGVTFVIEAW